ncbi:MAG: hypothetical protein RJA09_881 [Pseudomonadota bacterium]|jgi:uncharacterized membrane protein
MNRWWRVIKHQWADVADTHRVLPAAAVERLTQRVVASERLHTGEVRVCVEAGLPFSALWPAPSDQAMPAVLRQRALALFGELRVWDTRDNNGVLVYVQLTERAIEIVADRGLNDRLPAGHWLGLVDHMGAAFREGRFEEGLAGAVDAVTAVLVAHWPEGPVPTKANELPDAVYVC